MSLVWTAEKVRYYSNNPVAWAKDVLKIELDSWQRDVLLDFARGDKPIAVKSGNGVGKTALLAVAILWFLTTRPYPKVVATAPNKNQLFDVLWAELAKWISRSEYLKSVLEWTQTKVAWKASPGNWWAVARTAQLDNEGKVAEGLLGIHEEHTAFVIDEASGVPEQAITAAYGLMATGKARIIMTGNPLRLSGTFYEAFHKLKHLFHTYTVCSMDSPRMNQEFIDLMRGLYGEDSPMWFSRVLGEFPLEDTYTMFNPADLEKMYDPNYTTSGDVWMGCDIADGGADSSVFTVRQGFAVLEQRAFKKLDAVSNSEAISQMAKEFDPVRINIDGQGIGNAVCAILRKSGVKSVYDVHGNGVPKDKMFLNLRSEMYFHLARHIRLGDIICKCHCEQLKADLVRHYQEHREDEKYAVVQKSKMKKAAGSPDFSDSLCYSLYGDREFIEKVSMHTSPAKDYFSLNRQFRKKPFAPGFATISSSRFNF